MRLCCLSKQLSKQKKPAQFIEAINLIHYYTTIHSQLILHILLLSIIRICSSTSQLILSVCLSVLLLGITIYSLYTINLISLSVSYILLILPVCLVCQSITRSSQQEAIIKSNYQHRGRLIRSLVFYFVFIIDMM